MEARRDPRAWPAGARCLRGRGGEIRGWGGTTGAGRMLPCMGVGGGGGRHANDLGGERQQG